MNFRIVQTFRQYRQLLSVIAAGMMVSAVAWMFREENSGVGYVSVVGEVNTMQRNEILRELATMDSFSDINDIKKSLQQIEWVHRAGVAKDWPNRLIITVHEQEAIAYWNDDAYINEDGDVFLSRFAEKGRLPQLYGPEGKEQEIMHQYQQLSQLLMRIGQVVDTLRLDRRGSWEFSTRSGMRVLLGKEDIMKRTQRYIRVCQQTGLVENISRIARIDTRYSNGVAVDWKESAERFEVANAYQL